MSKIAWIGTGVMGASMASHLAAAGHTVKAYNRTSAKAEALKDKGIIPCNSIKDAVCDAEYVFTIVGYPKDVEEVYFLEDGILENAPVGAVLIDMTTSAPALAVKIFHAAKEKGMESLDAPVSGGDSGARNASLSIMTGGSKDVFDKVLPLFEIMGKNIVYMGQAGMGQHTKAANQIAVAGATAAMTEAIHYARTVGLDTQAMLDAIGAGAAGSWQLSNMAPRVLKGDFAPGFFVKHFIKDMNIVKGEAEGHDIELHMLASVLKMYEQLAAAGHENDGTQALIKFYEEK